MHNKYDVIVIGGGSAGFSVLEQISHQRLKIGLVENRKLGGSCPNFACVPTKALVKSAEVLHTVKTEEILMAIGRTPNIDMLDLDKAGVEYSKKGINTDEYMQSSAPRVIPRGTFCDPEIGSVGIMESQAREKGYEVLAAKMPYGGGRGDIVSDPAGLIKVTVDAKTRQILGASVIGKMAVEFVHFISASPPSPQPSPSRGEGTGEGERGPETSSG